MALSLTDGIDGFRKFLGFLKEKFPTSHSEIKKVFAEGDYGIELRITHDEETHMPLMRPFVAAEVEETNHAL